MDDLTLEQGKRCAIACKMYATAGDACWADWELVEIYQAQLKGKGDASLMIEDCIPIKASFWFPRLWDAGIAHKKHKHPWDTIRFIRELIETIIHTAKYSVRDICLALCEAIEALEG